VSEERRRRRSHGPCCGDLPLEERHLFARPLNERIEPDVRLEIGEVDWITGKECPDVIPLDDVPVVASYGLPQQR
jgi:hypothetical protein